MSRGSHGIRKSIPIPKPKCEEYRCYRYYKPKEKKRNDLSGDRRGSRLGEKNYKIWRILLINNRL